MTNYNERLDDVLVSFYNHAAQDVADNHLQEGKLFTTAHTEAKQAITSLIKELIAEAQVVDRKKHELEARMSELEVQLHHLRWMLTHYKPHTKNGLAHAERLLEERIEACKKELEKL